MSEKQPASLFLQEWFLVSFCCGLGFVIGVIVLFFAELAGLWDGFAPPAYPVKYADSLDQSKRAHKPARYVVTISLDGLRSDAISKLGPKALPHLFRLMREGASTLNARTEPDYSVTLPNHICMVTGRPVLGKDGHGYIKNRMPGVTIHRNAKRYIPSLFDLLHDRGWRTALFASKRKFVIFPLSYNKQGAKDRILPSDGRKKIDFYAIANRDSVTIDNIKGNLTILRPHFTLIHFRGPDTAGHWRGWMSPFYLRQVKQMDRYVGMILKWIEADALMGGRTTVLLTTDHGGTQRHHWDRRLLTNIKIPFLAWGKGVAKGKDLYRLNQDIVTEPGDGRFARDDRRLPWRNCFVARLSASLLGVRTGLEGLMGKGVVLTRKPTSRPRP